MALYDVLNGVYRKVTKKYDPVNGVYRKVTKAYDPVDGAYRQYFSGATPVSKLSVGDSIWLNVDGVLTEFLVIHQGNPDSAMYDGSCDGTWLLMKDVYIQKAWDSDSNDYTNSDIHTYLYGTFLSLLDSDIQSAIKQVKIPYRKGASGASVNSGSSGLSTKIFLLSCYEVGWTTSNPYFPVDGACLSYFSGCSTTDSKRIGYYSGNAAIWWLRSPYTNNATSIWDVNQDGGHSSSERSRSRGVRPAFILDSNTSIDQSTGINIIAS
jgi:hypothetical protein